MISEERKAFLLRTVLPATVVGILFLSGVWQLSQHLATTPTRSLTASVAASEVVVLTNENRTDSGLTPLIVSPLLTQAAQLKADDMARNSYYAHISPDGKTPLYWLDAVGYKYLNAGENLVIDRTSSEAAVTAWMNSPDHRENILRPQFTEIGVGVASGRYQGQDTIYVVEEFGTPYPTLAAPRPVASAPVPSSTHVAKSSARPTTATSTKTTSSPVTPSVPVAVASGINTNIAKLIVPTVRNLSVAPKKIVVATTTSVSATEATTSSSVTASTTTQATVAFALSPTFFKPVVLRAGELAATTTESPRGYTSPTWFEQVAGFIHSLLTSVPRVF